MQRRPSGMLMKQILGRFLMPFLLPLRIVFFMLAVLPFICVIILLFAIEQIALTESKWVVTQDDFQHAKNIINNPSAKTKKIIQLDEKDLNIALSYLLNHYTSSSSEISLRKGYLDFKITIRLKDNNLGKYLNIRFTLAKQQGYPVIRSFQIGRIRIANEFAGLMLESVIKYTSLKEYYILAEQHIMDIQIHAKKLTIVYIISPDFVLKNKSSQNKNYYQSVLFYQQQITRIIASHNPRRRLSLADLLQPLFKEALSRSSRKTAKAENRAVLIAVSSYVNKNKIQMYLPFDISPETKRQYPVVLYKRTDIAKHFMVSAVLAATGAETLAFILGQTKELSDAKEGSGFSFIDLAGDRAGLRFGTRAIQSKNKARQLQSDMSTIRDYTAFMPDVRDLPENLTEQAFKQQFDSIYSVNYQNILKKIDQRIAELKIYR